MKTIKKISILIILICLITSCEHTHCIYLVNNSYRSICVVSPELEYGIVAYPDTVLPSGLSINNDNLLYGTNNTFVIYEGLSGWYHLFNTRDTVSVFIIDADTINYYSLDSVIEKNMVLQRYDIGLNDVNDLCVSKDVSILSFPPTEAMKHIHMWPPYGTYDEHGQKKGKNAKQYYGLPKCTN